MLLTPHLAPALFAYACIVLAGLAMYYASRSLLPTQHRLIATALYMLNPYLVTTSLVRFSAAELLVQAMLPLLVLWFWQGVWQQNRRACILFAAALGAAWLTNIPATLVVLYSLAPLAFWRAFTTRSWKPPARFSAALAASLLLAAFTLAPLWAEQAWFSRASLVRVGARQLLLFMPPSLPHVPNLFHISCWIIALAAAALLALYTRKQTSTLWTALAWTTLVWQTPILLALWDHLPGLREVIFPYRFLAVLFAALPFVVLRPEVTRPRRWLYASFALLLTLPLGQYIRMQLRPATAQPPITQLLAEWRGNGYPGVPEWTPTGPDGHPATADFDPPLHLPPPTGCPTTMYTPRTFATNSPDPCHLLLPVFYFPYWHAIDATGAQLPIHPAEDGRMLIELPPGPQQVKLQFLPNSTLRTCSALISNLVWAALVLVFRVQKNTVSS